MKIGTRRRRELSACLTASLFLAGCAASPSVAAAKRGDLAQVRAEVAEEKARHRLDHAEVRELARVTADRELAHARPADILSRIEEARACPHSLSSALEAIAGRDDDAGASATLALLDGRAADTDGDRWLRKYRSSSQPLWRAVAARSAVGERFGQARRTFYADSDERVRLAAVRAALEEADRADAEPLLEAARLDPNPLARALATRALGAIANDEIVLALRDMYARADEGLRQSIVDAWAQDAAARAGGVRELVRVAETEGGPAAIEAGWTLLRFRRERDAEAVGTGALLRGIADNTARNRVLAILHAPVNDPRVVDRLRKAADSPDGGVAAAALLRLWSIPSARNDAVGRLEALSRSGAREATHALARIGNPAAIRSVAGEISTGSTESRLAAGRTLIASGELAFAADLLADPDPHVRMSTACAILNSRGD